MCQKEMGQGQSEATTRHRRGDYFQGRRFLRNGYRSDSYKKGEKKAADAVKKAPEKKTDSKKSEPKKSGDSKPKKKT